MDSVLQNFHRCAQALAGLMLAALAGCATVASQSAPTGNAVLKQEVIDTERAFARTMAMRDHVAFTGFLALQRSNIHKYEVCLRRIYFEGNLFFQILSAFPCNLYAFSKMISV